MERIFKERTCILYDWRNGNRSGSLWWKDKKSDTKAPKTQTEQSTNKNTNEKSSSQTEKKDDADIEKTTE